MGQKEKHTLFKEATGEKHQPKKKQKVIHPGKDDCGEDFSSLGDLTAFTTYDTCTAAEHAEFQLDLDEKTESFLLAVEVSSPPQYHFLGSEVPRTIQQSIVEMPMLDDVMIYLAKHSSSNNMTLWKFAEARHEYHRFSSQGDDTTWDRTSTLLQE